MNLTFVYIPFIFGIMLGIGLILLCVGLTGYSRNKKEQNKKKNKHWDSDQGRCRHEPTPINPVLSYKIEYPHREGSHLLTSEKCQRKHKFLQGDNKDVHCCCTDARPGKRKHDP